MPHKSCSITLFYSISIHQKMALWLSAGQFHDFTLKQWSNPSLLPTWRRHRLPKNSIFFSWTHTIRSLILAPMNYTNFLQWKRHKSFHRILTREWERQKQTSRKWSVHYASNSNRNWAKSESQITFEEINEKGRRTKRSRSKKRVTE